MQTSRLNVRGKLGHSRQKPGFSAISTVQVGRSHSIRPQPVIRELHVVRARSDEEEPDWEKEMSIFKQRTMRSNQLATLRELESKVNLGRVSIQ